MGQWLRVYLTSPTGDEVELSTRALSQGYKLLDGVRGFGLPKRTVESTPVAYGGSILQSQRFDESEVMLPVAIRSSNPDGVAELTRALEKVLAPASDEPLTIRVEAPGVGSVRHRRAYYVEGMEGALGGQDQYGLWRHVQIKLNALDPVWYGAERSRTFKVKTLRKPFITGVSDYVRTNYAVNPSFENGTDWWDAVSDVELESSGESHSGKHSLKVTVSEDEAADASGRVGKWEVSPGAAYVVSFWAKSTEGVQYLQVKETYAGAIVFIQRKTLALTRDWERYTVKLLKTPSGAVRASAEFYLVKSVGGRLEHADIGESVWIDDVLIEAGSQVGEYFDGDTKATGKQYAWNEDGTSTESAKSTTGYLPFFPIRLSGSTVQGEYDMDVQGDLPTWAKYVITGPGTDPTITHGNDTMMINGAITDPVTIDMNPAVADIYTDNLTSGEMWDRAGRVENGSIVDADFWELNPGQETIGVTMVGASNLSQIEVTYSDRWLAAY